ncbi:MAG: hypothetical protein JXO51_01390 [Candidatus Aminicenantes bacterium]|nr:hypothetical protein [Candidatus Aminicenantes bacterium]
MSLKTIFQEGMKERRRRKSLGRMSSELNEKEKAHDGLLTALGRKAWESKTDTSMFAELHASLRETQRTLDDLRTQSEQLQKQKQENEERRKQENDRLAGAQKQAEEKKREVDQRLEEQKSLLQAAQKESQQSRSRLGIIAGERGQLQSKIASPEAGEAEKSEWQQRLDLLAKEEEALQAGIHARDEAGKPVSARVASLQEESGQEQKQLDALRQEQKRINSELDKKISALKSELDQNGVKVREAETKQKGDFRLLGEKLAATQGGDPGLSGERTAVAAARSEMEGMQALIGGLERQKEETQVSAYKKMMTIIIGAIVLLAALAVALILLLAPKKKASPLAVAGPGQEGAQRMEQLAQAMQKGMEGIKAESEKIQGGKISIAAEGVMKSALPVVGGWQMQEPRYGRSAYGEMETASLEADYAAADGRSVRVHITDAGTASALLAGLKMILAMNIRIDNPEAFQQVTTIKDTPVVERLDKKDGDASIGIIFKDRYLVELKTHDAGGLELLRQFAAKLDLSKLP